MLCLIRLFILPKTSQPIRKKFTIVYWSIRKQDKHLLKLRKGKSKLNRKRDKKTEYSCQLKRKPSRPKKLLYRKYCLKKLLKLVKTLE